jgi:hypothetical protein
MDELVRNVHDAIEGCLSVDIVEPKPGGKDRILEMQPGVSQPSTSCFLSTDVDARDTSASTRVFDALLSAHDGEFARAKAS